MKEIKLSFEVSIVLERTDVHWVEEELLRIREETFLVVFKRVMREIVEEAIGLGCGEQMSLGVRERALWAAVEVSYEKAHQFLEKFTGLEVSRHKIHGMALEEGRKIEFWEEEGRRQVFEQGHGLDGM